MNIVTIFKLILKNLLGMVLTERLVIWGAKLAVAKTTNKIDDNVVLLLEAGYSQDVAKLQQAVETLANIYDSRRQSIKVPNVGVDVGLHDTQGG